MRLTITRRLIPVIAVAVLGVTLMTAVGQIMSNRIFRSGDYVNRNIVPSLLLLAGVRKSHMLSRVKAYHLLTSVEGNGALEFNELFDYRRKVEENLNAYEFNGCAEVSCISDANDQKLLAQEQAQLANYHALISQAIAEYRQGQKSQLQNILISSTDISLRLQSLFDQHLSYKARLGQQSAELARHEKDHMVLLLIAAGLLTLLITGSIAYASIQSIRHQLGGEPEDAAEITARLALGDLSSTIQLQANDSTSLMAKIQQLIQTMEKVADRADAISRGNLSDQVIVLSHKDRLGHAINHMVVALRTARLLDDRRTWLSNGNQLLAQALTGDYSSQQIADLAMRQIGSYMGAGRGVFYARKKDPDLLVLCASYMLGDDPYSHQNFRFGEGAIGQVALQQIPAILGAGQQHAAPIVTGTASFYPTSIAIYPVLKDKILLGVIEFSSMEAVDEVKLDYLSASIELFASYLQIAEQRGQIHTLLSISEQAEREVRKQYELLQDINYRMEEQQHQLQQQSEELQQTNAQMEQQQQLLEQNNEKLRLSEADINEKAHQLQLSNQYKSEFLANMSHELRTPLNAIILLSKMMIEDIGSNLSAKEIKRAEVIHQSGHDLLGIINEVLDLSKVDAGRMDINIGHVFSNAMASELHDLFESRAQSAGIAFHIDDQLTGAISSDHIKISQILRNLLSNAFKFTAHGSITLSMRRSPDSALPIEFSVTDTGIGIPIEKHQTIFDAFRQVDGSNSREYGGTGLGLTISLRFAELLGGTIRLASTLGTGSCFTLCLPACAPQTEALSRGAVPPIATATAAPVLGRVADDRRDLQPGDNLILLIDDDINLGNAVVEINHRRGYKTVVAHNGNDGLFFMRKFHPTGVLLDLCLPDCDGIDLLQEIKSASDLATIPVYIISARDYDPDIRQQDIVGYLQKPVISAQIEAAEAALFDAFSRSRPKAIETSTNIADGKNLVGKKILIIDDDPRNLFVITAALEQNQAVVFNALNGRRALELLETITVDLIITDIMMPEMDGYQTIAAIRNHPRFKTVPIIALSAKAMPEDRKNILEIGADDYLSKPVDYDVLCKLAALWASSTHEPGHEAIRS